MIVNIFNLTKLIDHKIMLVEHRIATLKTDFDKTVHSSKNLIRYIVETIRKAT